MNTAERQRQCTGTFGIVRGAHTETEAKGLRIVATAKLTTASERREAQLEALSGGSCRIGDHRTAAGYIQYA